MGVLLVSNTTDHSVVSCICVYFCYEVVIMRVYLLLLFLNLYITNDLLEMNHATHMFVNDATVAPAPALPEQYFFCQ